MISSVQKQAFHELIEVLHELGLLSHLMVVGSWAEYLYTLYYDAEYVPNIRTLDVDLLYRNINLPRETVNIYEPMRSRGSYMLKIRYLELGSLLKTVRLKWKS